MEEHEEDDLKQVTYESAKEAFNELADLWKLYMAAHPRFVPYCLRKDIGIEDIIYTTLEPHVSKFLYH